jgi:hypothetical protein
VCRAPGSTRRRSAAAGHEGNGCGPWTS